MIGQPHPGQARRVQRPQHAAAVLHADRNRRRHLVEQVTVQRSRDRLVVADGPDPTVTADSGVGKDTGKVVATPHLRRADAGRGQRGCGRAQVDMMVVNARNDGSARGVEDVLALVRRQSADLHDPLAGADVGFGAVEQHCSLNQHGAKRLSASNRSTVALSAPSSDAGSDGTGIAVQLRLGSAVIRGVGCGDGGHRQFDQLTSPATQRFHARKRGVQAGQRVGDRVAAERRVAIGAVDQTAGHSGVVAERHPAGLLADGTVAGDPQPDPAVARRDVGRAEAPVFQCRSP